MSVDGGACSPVKCAFKPIQRGEGTVTGRLRFDHRPVALSTDPAVTTDPCTVTLLLLTNSAVTSSRQSTPLLFAASHRAASRSCREILHPAEPRENSTHRPSENILAPEIAGGVLRSA